MLANDPTLSDRGAWRGSSRSRVETIAARERLRMERAAHEPARVESRGRHELTITFHNRLTGAMHALDLHRGSRRDQFDARADGKPWKRGMSATAIAAAIRRKLAAHIGH